MKINNCKKFFRPNIARMTAYQPGEQPQTNSFIKLNTNESPYPTSELIVDRLKEACTGDLRLYPDPTAKRLRDRLSKIFSQNPEQFIIGNGSDELLTIIIRSFAEKGDPIAYAYPTYGYYQPLIEVQGARAIVANYPDDFSLPQELAENNARITFLVNPNSPSGTLLPLDIIDNLANHLDGILVVDEAYVDFSSGGAMDLIKEHDNVIVVRTMSKSFGLAGLRIGFACAHADIISGMLKVKEHYNVNSLSMVAAEAAVEDIETMRINAAKICQTREHLTNALREMDFFVWNSEANFVLTRPQKIPARILYEELKKQQILVRFFDQPRLNDCLRISIGTDEQNRLLIENLRTILTKL